MTGVSDEIELDDFENEGEEIEESAAEEEAEESEEPEDKEDKEDSDDELAVIIDGEEASEDEQEEEKAPAWVKELRKANKEDKRRIRELEAELNQVRAPNNSVIEIGAKPDLSDYAFDTDAYDEAMLAWAERKRAVEAKQAQAREEEQAELVKWQNKLNKYGEAKARLRAKDYDDVEATAQDIFSLAQQAIIVKGASDPALLIYGLAKKPERAKKLAAITDPIEFAFALSKLEEKISVKKKGVPPPEKQIKGSQPKSGDHVLEKLRAEAEKTGDYRKILEYKKKIKSK